MRFGLAVTNGFGRTAIGMRGPIGTDSVDHLESAFTSAVARGDRAVDLDMSAVSTIQSDVGDYLVDAHAWMIGIGVRLCVVRPSPPVIALLTRLGCFEAIT